MTVNKYDVIRVAAKQFGPKEQQIVNVFFYRADLVPPSVPDLEVMTAITTQMDRMFLAIEDFIPTGQVADEIDYYNLTQDVPMGSMGWPTYTGGHAMGDFLPEGSASLLSASTAVKRVIPKKFLGVHMEANQANGEWTSALMSALGVLGGYWWESISLGVDGLLKSGTWRRLLKVFVPLVTVIVKSLCSYQRRRKPTIGG